MAILKNNNGAILKTDGKFCVEAEFCSSRAGKGRNKHVNLELNIAFLDLLMPSNKLLSKLSQLNRIIVCLGLCHLLQIISVSGALCC